MVPIAILHRGFWQRSWPGVPVGKSLLVLVAACAVADKEARAQASTDACGFTAGAQYPVNATCTNVAFNKPNGYGPNMTPTGCGGSNNDDAFGWFAGTGNPVIVQYTPPGGGDAVLHVFSGTCAAPVQLACSDNCCDGAVESVTIPTAIGTNYIVRVQRYGVNTGMNGNLCIYTAPPPPANDDPCSAAPLLVNASCTYTTATTADATGTSGPPAPTCASYNGGDVWFSLVVPAGGGLIIDTDDGVITDGGMALYTAPSCSGPFTQVACDDDGSANGFMPRILATGLAPGSTVYARFWEFGNDNPGSFSICAQEFVPPANDEPCTATVAAVNNDLTCTLTTPGTLVGATASGNPASPCFGNPDDDVWFSFTAAATTHFFSLNNVAGDVTDLYHAVYAGTCGSLANISCSDPESSALTGLTVGNTYWVRVYSYTDSDPGDISTFDLCITTPLPIYCGDPFNDPGGPAANYANDAVYQQTICPTNAGDLVSLNFSSFQTENGVDELLIYNGPSTAYSLIGAYSGSTLPPRCSPPTPPAA